MYKVPTGFVTNIWLLQGMLFVLLVLCRD